MRRTNYTLKALCIDRCGSQLNAARRVRMHPTRLSLIINSHIRPNERDLAALSELFGAEALSDCDLLRSDKEDDVEAPCNIIIREGHAGSVLDHSHVASKARRRPSDNQLEINFFN